MATPPIPDDRLKTIVAAVEDALVKGYKPPGVVCRMGEKSAFVIAAQALGYVNPSSLQKVLSQAAARGFAVDWSKSKYQASETAEIPENDYEVRASARRGELGISPVLPGFRITQTTEKTGKNGEVTANWVKQEPDPGEVFGVPDGHSVWGVSALVDPDGREIAKWVKTKEDWRAFDQTQFVADMSEHFKDFTPTARRKKAPKVDRKDLVALYPWSDPHFGLLIWGREAQKDWDLKIAVETFESVFDSVVDRTPRTEKAILVVGGDTIHADDNNNVTPTRRNPLQVDGRHQKVFLTAGETIVNIATRILYRHAELEIEVLPGNHDPTSSFPLAAFLHAWFRKEPRVTVSLSPALHRFHQFGKVGFGFTHGHTLKKAELHTVFAQDAAKIWGDTDHRYFHTFHVHHDSVIDKGGCRVESHGVIVPPDVFAYGAGYGGARNQKSIIYHRERGWHGSVVETV